jgi:hypothetical protein
MVSEGVSYVDAYVMAQLVHRMAEEEERAIMEGPMGNQNETKSPYPPTAGYAAGDANPAQGSVSERYYDVRLPASTIRRMAKLSPDADRKLRIQVPEAFSEVVRFTQESNPHSLAGRGVVRVASQPSTTLDVVHQGPQAGVGIYLPGDYIWAIEPYRGPYASFSLASVLTARRLF